MVFLNSENEACLGTPIHKQWLLTAAHCFLLFLEIEIAILKGSFQNKMKNLRPMLAIQHPSFTWDSAEHGIMLIKLTDPLKLNNQVKLVVLPRTTTDRRLNNCTVFVWGWSWKNSNVKPDVEINQTVFCFPNEYCQDSPIGKMPFKITENMFCAGSSLESTHSCKEVAAAPILCQYQLQGILSWSEGYIRRGDVGHYTKVSHYTDWILKVINTY
ncbi:hypothetical protein DBR06_SOUSAS16110012 [Sousa chinensis]|nr:hypothetical protein DBR06_SOUSAS16110012 [Sousa chinensis]